MDSTLKTDNITSAYFGRLASDASALEELDELFLGQTGIADQSAERAFGKLTMVGDCQPTTGRMAKDDVAAGLMIHFVGDLAKGAHGVRARTDWQAAHTETSTISSVIPPGIGSPCFSRLWR